jgi:hypothetical protein
MFASPRAQEIDNDPLVLTHAWELLTSTSTGATDYLDADARDTSKILAAAAATLDFEKPVAVLLLGVLRPRTALAGRGDVHEVAPRAG